MTLLKIMFEKVYQKIMSQLENSLPAWLHYHSPEHTRYVLKQAEIIAEKENISEEDLLLIRIAALYHDSGFLISPKNHEKLGCQIAGKELTDYDLEAEQIKKICGMIMATRIPQKPKNLLEKILADADLEYLGTNKFEEFGNQLYQERLHFHPDMSLDEWNEIQIEFMSNHHYHTNFCKQHRQPKKQANLEKIKKAVDSQ